MIFTLCKCLINMHHFKNDTVYSSFLVFIVAVSCWYSTCFAVSACDGLCHLTKIMDRVETPFGFQPIVWTFVRHTVYYKQVPDFSCPPGSCQSHMVKVNTIGFLQFLPSGQHGLCFGCCFPGPLPLRSQITVHPSWNRPDPPWHWSIVCHHAFTPGWLPHHVYMATPSHTTESVGSILKKVSQLIKFHIWISNTFPTSPYRINLRHYNVSDILEKKLVKTLVPG